MITGTRNIAIGHIPKTIGPPHVLLTRTLDFVMRACPPEAEERIEDKGKRRQGDATRGDGRVIKPIFHFQNTLHILTGLSGEHNCFALR